MMKLYNDEMCLVSKLVLKGSILHVLRCHVMLDVYILNTYRWLFIFLSSKC